MVEWHRRRTDIIWERARVRAHSKLKELGALESEAFLAIDLDNETHPIFRRSNWKGIDDATYKRWRSTLQLASLFLTERNIMDWWVRAILGNEVDMAPEGHETPLQQTEKTRNLRRKGYRKPNTFLRNIDNITELHYQKTEEFLYQLADVVVFTRGDCLSRATWPPDVYAATVPLTYRYKGNFAIDLSTKRVPFTYRNLVFPTLKYWPALTGKSEIWLHRTFWKYHEASSNASTSLSEAQQLRIRFRIAITLVHEIAHATMIHRFAYGEERLQTEKDPEREAGRSWEMTVIGGLLDAQSFEKGIGLGNVHQFTSAGIAFIDWNAESHFVFNGEHSQVVIVDMKYIHSWFRKSTWAAVRRKGIQGLPQLPLPCPGVILVNKTERLLRVPNTSYWQLQE
ncbi:hypothetical protein EJ08DRAFT_703240 [Tothia fuscella]|uniref:Uncharacterized protein n=1 Tax=Tothia fuscella TaxID=1048955 RepID=A0A9P4NET6_9PEZI|nr:hypothetical protein EJ08DRAFT_703240 [Tothia fuscella]